MIPVDVMQEGASYKPISMFTAYYLRPGILVVASISCFLHILSGGIVGRKTVFLHY